MSTVFLYETSLIQEMSELLAPSKDVGDWVVCSAVYALDACAHHRHKLSEVLSAVGGNVSHGALMSLFRHISTRLTGGNDPSKAEDVPFELLDAMLTFVAFIGTSPPHSSHIVSAGVIPVLLELIKTPVDRRENVGVLRQGAIISVSADY